MSRCRSCGAAIEWATVTASGRRMPVDATPELYGNLRLEWIDGELQVEVVGPGNGTHVSHFVSCPNADRHRTPATV